ncbi:hypothetical protein HXX76_014444 [Chlamydomonas incerta]|uniref:Uncharacterized protein n=1 Tax=Chlamydomonas incerta TaxID=51695 RepID=A0A835SLP1_CHLIN|nr:hypothetical protein HXX76_014444 [Chlamydomonas incerta]|eukprot:KAG2424564.1 hypothetical protein HXX76_014444 [Chlamydomonas incerta]
MREALDLFQGARHLAYLQTQSELEAAFIADLELTAQSTAEPSPREALVSYWTEQGLTKAVAEGLVRKLEKAGRPLSVAQLNAKVQRLTRIIPDLDFAQLVDRDVDVLDTDPSLAIRNMVLLVEAFPGKEVGAIVQRSPRLLYTPDLRPRLERCLELLTRLHPARERKVVAPVVAEYPDLVYRMDYYTHVRMIDELPIEIQNMFVLADQGIGFLHRYYKRAKNNFVADTSDEEAGF